MKHLFEHLLESEDTSFSDKTPVALYSKENVLNDIKSKMSELVASMSNVLYKIGPNKLGLDNFTIEPDFDKFYRIVIKATKIYRHPFDDLSIVYECDMYYRWDDLKFTKDSYILRNEKIVSDDPEYRRMRHNDAKEILGYGVRLTINKDIMTVGKEIEKVLTGLDESSEMNNLHKLYDSLYWEYKARIVDKVKAGILNKLAHYGLKTNKKGYIVYGRLELYIIDDYKNLYLLIRPDDKNQQKYLKDKKYEEMAKKFPDVIELEKTDGVPRLKIKKEFFESI